jgi:uncharacterized membrane protein YfcA
MGFGGILGRYIQRRHYIRPLIVGLVVGTLAGISFGYYLVTVIDPGILGLIAIIFLALVFGLVATAVTAFIFFYIQLYRMTKIMVEEMCANCGNRLPRGASFCPYCGSTIGNE